jgi:peptide/nickel transport system ATP-binding protein
MNFILSNVIYNLKGAKDMFELKNINMSFALKNAFLRKETRAQIIRDFNLVIKDNEIIAIVGESGCGKTTIGKIITGLLTPTSGEVLYNNNNIESDKNKSHSTYRREIQFIQQDSYAALNPVKTIYQSLLATVETYDSSISRVDANIKINELMEKVGLSPAEQFLFKYPHQLSGGQRQRILMIRALCMNAKLIVADEPVSMIDVSLRISILNLITSLNKEFNIAFVYITHDLATAKYIASNGRICVMYLGDIVELGSVHDVLYNPKHPYTQALISAVPIPDPFYIKKYKRININGMEMTNLAERGNGCSFAPRCPYVTDKCRKSSIPYQDINGVKVKCINLDEVPKWNI